MAPNFIFKNFNGLISVFNDKIGFKTEKNNKIFIINIIQNHETNLQLTCYQYATNLLPT
jgi:hypothetical protein